MAAGEMLTSCKLLGCLMLVACGAPQVANQTTAEQGAASRSRTLEDMDNASRSDTSPRRDEGWLPWPTRIATEVTQVASFTNPCAQRRDGSVVCWASGGSGQMSAALVRYVQAVSRGPGSAFPVQEELLRPLDTRTVGPLVELTWPDGPTPFEPATTLDGRPIGAATGSDPCALSGEREATCWGPSWGRPQPARVSFEERPVSIAVSSEWMTLTCCWGSCQNDDSHACVVMESGRVRCWGGGSVGQLGDGAREPSRTPVRVQGITDARQLALGTHHSCALDATGAVSCWGYNLQGQLGDGSRSSVSVSPVEAVGVTDAAFVYAGEYHSCALTRDARAVCWGSHIARGIEDETDPLPAYLDVPGKRFVALSLGGRHTCALDESGDLWCGGYL